MTESAVVASGRDDVSAGPEEVPSRAVEGVEPTGSSFILPVAVCAAAAYWLFILASSDAYFVGYLAAALVAAVLPFLCRKKKARLSRARLGGVASLAAVLSCMVVAANYKLLAGMLGRHPQGGLPMFLDIVAAAFFVVATIAVFASCAYYGYAAFARYAGRDDGEDARDGENAGRSASWKWFVGCWVLLAAAYLAVFWLGCYPGTLTYDSFEQVKQAFGEPYSNHHPFYHTLLIQASLNLGLSLFGDMNAAVATYSVFQCIVMAAVFAFAVETMAEAGAKRWMLVAATAAFAVLPCHWSYASTMWKDVLFGGFVLLFACSLFRLRKGLGGKLLPAVLLPLSSVGICLLRSNGTIAFVVVAAVVLAAAFAGRKDAFANARLVSVEVVASLCLSLVLLGPVLWALDVKPADKVESLSVPLQQMARVMADREPLSEEELRTLGRFVDIYELSKTYDPGISDPVKNLARSHGANEALEDGFGDFVALYTKVGIEHPASYLAAWIDQTKGYWNSGYPYWVVRNVVIDNDFGVEKAPASLEAAQAIAATMGMIDDEGCSTRSRSSTARAFGHGSFSLLCGSMRCLEGKTGWRLRLSLPSC